MEASLSESSWAFLDGFYEARDGKPLAEDSSPRFVCGWRAYHQAAGQMMPATRIQTDKE